MTGYCLRRAGFEASDSRILQLILLAAQKLVSDIASDALQHCKTKGTAWQLPEQEQGLQVRSDHRGLDPCPQGVRGQCEEASLLHLSCPAHTYLPVPISPHRPVFLINFIMTKKG